MRVQYSIAENKVINERRDKHENFDGICIPVEMQGQVLTMGLLITDVHRFNVFVEDWLRDQGLEDSKIANEIGADIVHIDFRPPIQTDHLLFLQNYINGMLYGPTQEEEPAEENENIQKIDLGEDATITKVEDDEDVENIQHIDLGDDFTISKVEDNDSKLAVDKNPPSLIDDDKTEELAVNGVAPAKEESTPN